MLKKDGEHHAEKNLPVAEYMDAADIAAAAQSPRAALNSRGCWTTFDCTSVPEAAVHVVIAILPVTSYGRRLGNAWAPEKVTAWSNAQRVLHVNGRLSEGYTSIQLGRGHSPFGHEYSSPHMLHASTNESCLVA